ncbi:radical SAM protein [Desulfovibrio sp. TomC]|uniref:radical SAM protein n=1 Tax=Desulfovibrio sp. TomC TaxID=1562888 RepID=UPI0005744BF9|nr:radical SAM protein [Desulfovibrio sp. TomC]KHK00285.1 Radical SAM domain protein [Desulfovibrio sp. TomC]
MDKYRIDSHKLLFHVDRVHQWLQDDLIIPLYMEISPAGACNHRCIFCGLDFMGYKPRFLPRELLRERFAEMARLGLKSIMLAGEGEPFMHKALSGIVLDAKQAGIDVAITTNAVLMRPEISEQILPACSWIKVSCNAGEPETYARVHGTNAADFKRVFDNLEQAVAIRERQGSGCTLGLQALLLPDNANEISSLAKRCRDIGLNYIVVKPYSQHPLSKTTRYADVAYAGYEALAQELDGLSNDSFQVVFRLSAMHKWDDKRHDYARCLSLPFWSYLDAGGNIWGCSMHMGNERFLYGNIHEQTFAEIWKGERRQASLDWCRESLDPTQCRVNCRMDAVNTYLWELTHPGPHVNFI